MPTQDNEKDLEDQELDKEELEDTDPNNISDGDKPTADNTDWEKSYKGLQKTAVKKQEQLQATIEKLTKDLEELTEKTQSGETDKLVLVKQLDKAKSELDEAKAGLEEATAEKEKLDNILKRTDLIGKKYPTLAPMQKFIPQGKDLDEYEQNAAEFAEAMQVYTKNFLSSDITGSSPPPPEKEEKIDENKEDQLWSIIRNTAGVAGQEDKYNKAYADWMAIQEAKDN